MAKSQLEHALSVVEGERPQDIGAVLGLDPRVHTAAWLALTSWHLGEVDRTRSLINTAIAVANETGNMHMVVHARLLESIIESRRDDAAAAFRAAETTSSLARQHGMAVYIGMGELLANWARGRLFNSETAQRL